MTLDELRLEYQNRFPLVTVRFKDGPLDGRLERKSGWPSDTIKYPALIDGVRCFHLYAYNGLIRKSQHAAAIEYRFFLTEMDMAHPEHLGRMQYPPPPEQEEA